MSKILTISIAAYNVEQYLEKLLDTIIEAECMEKLEVLVVNDGSKDGTADIANKYHDKYPESIFLVDKENGGHGSTINKGMERATGKYFKVIDGDDWVDSKGLKELVDKLENDDSDMIVTNYQECYETGDVIDKTYPMFNAGVKEKFNDVCCKVDRIVFHAVYFKTKLLQENNIKITENCFYVDAEYVLYPIPYVDTITYYDSTVYCYRLGLMGQSVSIESLQKNINMHMKVSRNLLKFCAKVQSDLQDNVKKFVFSSVAMVNNKTFDTLLSFPCRRDTMHKIKEFDEYIKNTCSPVCEYFPNKTVRALRKNIAIMYPMASGWVKIKRKLGR